MSHIKMQSNQESKLWLYNEGNEFIDITGGWSADGYVGYSDNKPLPVRQGIKNANNLSLSVASIKQYTMFGTQSIMQLSKFNKLCLELNCTLYNGPAVALSIRSNPTKVLYGGSGTSNLYVYWFEELPKSTFSKQTITIDISSWDTDVYLNFSVADIHLQTYNIYKIWLDK